MSTNKTEDDIYWELVESFIEKANGDCDQADPGLVSAALLNAAARFNAFVVAFSSIDRKEFTEDIDDTTHYLTGRYKDLLKGHMEDYRANYKTYIRADEEQES